MNRYVPNISGFVDFCEYCMDGKPIYFVSRHLFAGFDMLCDLRYYFNFIFPNTKKEIENAIQENLYMFDIFETNAFYYPNDNMFSGDNSEYGINGYVLKIKEKYRKNKK